MASELLGGIGPFVELAGIAAAAGAVWWRIGRVEKDLERMSRKLDDSVRDQGRRIGDHDKAIVVLRERIAARRPTQGGTGGE